MTTRPPTLLDEVMPEYDLSAKYSVRVKASPQDIYRIVERGLPSGLVTRFLMLIRSLPRRLRASPDCDLPENPFYRLKQLEGRELVVGIIGQFWKPVANIFPISSLDEFLQFDRPGYCKAALNLRIEQQGNDECLVITETRILSFGEAKKHFKEYWRLIGPFSGLIRKEILRKVKTTAEKTSHARKRHSNSVS